MTDPVNPDPIEPPDVAPVIPGEPKKVELPPETVAVIRRELVKVLTGLKTPRKISVLFGKMHSALNSLATPPDIQGLSMRDLLADGYLADGKELLWDGVTETYSVPKVTPQAPDAAVSAIPAPTKEKTPDGWKNVSEIPLVEQTAIAQEIFRVMLRTRHLQPSDFAGKQLRAFLDSLSPAARKGFSVALIGFGGEPGTFGELFISQGLANPLDTKNINSQIELRTEVADIPAASYAKALKILEDAETSGQKPLRPTLRALQYEAQHAARAEAWQRLMSSSARMLRPDPIQLGAALGLAPTLDAGGKRRFSDADYDAIARFRRELVDDGVLSMVASDLPGGKKGALRAEFAVEPQRALSYAMALTEMLWRKNTKNPYEPVGELTKEAAKQRLEEKVAALTPHITRFESAIQALESAAADADTTQLQADALAERTALKDAYVSLEQLCETIADPQMRTTLEKAIVLPVRNQCLDLDGRYNKSRNKNASDTPDTPVVSGEDAQFAEFLSRMESVVEAATPSLIQYEQAAEAYRAAQAAGNADEQRKATVRGRTLDTELMRVYQRIRQAKQSLPSVSDRVALERKLLDPLRLRIESAYAAFKQPRGDSPVKDAPKEATIDAFAYEPASADTVLGVGTDLLESSSVSGAFDVAGKKVETVAASRASALQLFEQGDPSGLRRYLQSLPEAEPRRVPLLEALTRFEAIIALLSRPEMTVPSTELDDNIALLEARIAGLNQRIARSKASAGAISEKDRALLTGLEQLQNQHWIKKIPLLGQLFTSAYVKRAQKIIESKGSIDSSNPHDASAALAWISRHKDRAVNRHMYAFSEKKAIENALHQLQEIKARATAHAPERERLFAALREERRRITALLKA